MRILDEFNFGLVKVTIFIYNEKLSMKFEKNLVEIVMKFRDGSPIITVNDAKTFCSEPFMDQIDSKLDLLAKLRYENLSSATELDEESLPEIY